MCINISNVEMYKIGPLITKYGLQETDQYIIPEAVNNVYSVSDKG